MKFLDVPSLLNLNAMLGSGVDVGDGKVYCRLENYSCKLSTADKHLKKCLDHQMVADSLSHGADSSCVSTLGDHSPSGSLVGSLSRSATGSLGSVLDPATRKLLIDLILLLNQSFPDYDFSSVSPDDFVLEPSYIMLQQSVTNKLARIPDAPALLPQIWAAIEATIHPSDCLLVSYALDDDDLYGARKIWSFNYFFCNKKMKQILSFSGWMTSKDLARSLSLRSKHSSDSDAESDEDDDDDVNGMEM